jgi:hypothetical protein
MKKPQLGRAFLIGIFFGLLVYGIYIASTSSNEELASGFGWLFFWPQYPVAFVARLIGVETAPVGFCYIPVALYYGYIFVSIRLAPKVAAAWFVISGGAFLFGLGTHTSSPH